MKDRALIWLIVLNMIGGIRFSGGLHGMNHSGSARNVEKNIIESGTDGMIKYCKPFDKINEGGISNV